ncbi:MAG: hypothetical protein EA397_17900 [Deltaproteobacteria bacterium]|nr:MAG: hypothetical protein EA397_17900 [Deltaproteobacteria bacterium]
MRTRYGRALGLATAGFLTLGLGLACGGMGVENRPLTPAEEAVVLHPTELVERLGVDAEVDASKVSCSYDRVFGNVSLACRTFGRDEWSMEYKVSTFVMASDTERALFTKMSDNSTILTHEGFEVSPIEGAWSWGDDRDCRALHRNGAPAGILCMGRKGTRTVSFKVTGLVVEGPGVVDRLLDQELSALEAWSTQAP